MERSFPPALPLFHTGMKLLGPAVSSGLQAWLSTELGAWQPVSFLQHFSLHCFFAICSAGDRAHPDKQEEPSGLATGGVTGHHTSCPQLEKCRLRGGWPSERQDLAASSSRLGGNREH